MDIQKTTLKNGVTVLVADTKAFPSVTVLVLVGVGSRYENEHNCGVAHFFEHMSFKGSSKYKDALTLTKTIEGLGAEYNAFTSKEYTGYYIKVPVRHAETALDILSDMIQSPLLKQEEIDRERGVITEELNTYEDMPQHKVHNMYEETMYLGHQLGWEIGGTKETVAKMDRETISSFLTNYYLPTKTTVIIAGGIGGILKSKVQITNRAEELFGEWRRGEKHKIEAPSYNPPVKNKPAITVHTKKTEQTHLVYGFPTFSYFDSRKHNLTLLSIILGGGMSSRLFHEVREQRGLCYYIYSTKEQYSDAGSIYTSAGVNNDIKKINEALKTIQEEQVKLAEEGVTEEELVRAKEYLKGNMLLSMEDSYTVASFIGKKQVLEGTYSQLEEVLKRIDAVSQDSLKALAAEIFIPNKAVLTIVGPLKKEEITGI